MRRRLAGAGAGLLADLAFGEPRIEPHPVAAFGELMTRVEARLWRDERGAGVVHAAAGLAVGAAAGGLLGSTAASTYVAVAGRQLGDTALAVGHALEAGDLAGARALLPSLAGRDPDVLDEAGIARAVVESVAENTVDAVVAPAMWAAVAGGPGVLAHRAANTMDAMVGHRTERHRRYGWAAARVDDAMAWVPARATAGLVALARPAAASEIWRAVRVDAPAHPSPNSGVAEAAFAGALDLRLGGPTTYPTHEEARPFLGRGHDPEAVDIGRAVRLLRDVTVTLATVLLSVGTWRRARR